MMQKSSLRRPYLIPGILQQVTFQLESDLLARSVVDSMNAEGVFTTSQEVDEQNFSEAAENNYHWD